MNTSVDRKNYKILFVDDEKKILIVARKVLRSAGYNVEVCLSPDEAAEIISNRGPVAILLTDDRMPGMRGTELLEQVKRISPNTVRVLTTAFYDQQLIEAIVNKGEAFRFIKKPIDFNKIHKVIRECIDQYEINCENQKFKDSLKGLDSDHKSLVREAEILSGKIKSLKRRVALISIIAILLVSGFAGFDFYREYERQQRLKETSVTLGDWVVYDNNTALDSVHRLMWMTEDYRLVEGKYPSSWERAQSWVDLMNAKRFGGYGDWRMPTIQEYKISYDPDLTKLAFDKNRDYPVGYAKAFRDGGGYGFWAIDEVGGDSAKYFFFAGGYEKTAPKTYNSPTMSVRLVRTVK
ncbi:MAG: response regulator [candidate division Zixibacteria bacterium]|nr:response regulator [candidate division KSB1 bacterium]NIR67542.1 response regulator [candidate division Zixibacteria bacterium]NIS45192.1 response regulator [candidate division Zixibacteria bacterium]NIT72099.1 response regulator [candidate division KSB1 bacterium]NIU12970.1 response regulator [candidate division Zixibacteria bacterium]